jgi:hypothetical protein
MEPRGFVLENYFTLTDNLKVRVLSTGNLCPAYQDIEIDTPN